MWDELVSLNMVEIRQNGEEKILTVCKDVEQLIVQFISSYGYFTFTVCQYQIGVFYSII